KRVMGRSGAKAGLVVTAGTRDVYIIGRGNRPEAYNLFFHRHRPLVLRHLTREVVERMLGSGEIHVPLARASVAAACEILKEAGVEAGGGWVFPAFTHPDPGRGGGGDDPDPPPQAPF